MQKHIYSAILGILIFSHVIHTDLLCNLFSPVLFLMVI